MNKSGRRGLAAVVALLSLTFSSQGMAAFVLNSTRYIYGEGSKNISFEVTNSADKTYGGQVWVDNTDQGDGVYMVPQPPFFKVGAGQKQVIRIIRTDSSLPEDRESLFWLNVQEIPPAPERKDGDEGSVLALAMDVQVKLIYRPASIKNGRLNAEKQLIKVQCGNATCLKNPTPYYMAVTKVKSDGKELHPDKKVMAELAQLKPFSEVSLGLRVGGKLSVDAVNDWGGVQSYTPGSASLDNKQG